MKLGGGLEPVVTRTPSGIEPKTGPYGSLQRRVLPAEHFIYPPLVIDGHTFVTLLKFDKVAMAIAECAFVTTDLPIILSLEAGFEDSNCAAVQFV
jgi:hypothetical protein